MNIALGLLSMSRILTADREDGTLLRAKATPNGMRGHLVGKVSVGGGLLADLAIFLVPGAFVVSGLAIGGPAAWFTLAWVLFLGMVAPLPVGAVLGSLLTSARGLGLVQLAVLGVVAISGIFNPITALPAWVQWIAQVFPIYWLDLGMRSALLPDAAVAVEIGESWRHLETAGVLGAWAVVGPGRRCSGPQLPAARASSLARVRKKSRTSAESSSGTSMAAKWPPRSNSDQCRMS